MRNGSGGVKMYEEAFFKLGFVLGYIFIWALMCIICVFYYMLMEKRFNRFLLETKQHQKYAEWKSKLKSPYKIVKNDS